REPLAGDLERGARTRGVLEEEVDHRPSTQGRELLDLAGLDVMHLCGGREDLLDVGDGDVVDAQQVLHSPSPAPSVATVSRRTSSSPSVSTNFSRTRSD